MKKYKKMLFTIVVIIAILLILILLLIKKINSKESNSSQIIQSTTTNVNGASEDDSKKRQGISREDYFAIKKVVDSYYNSIYTILNINNNAKAGDIAEDDLKTIRENQKNQYINIFNTLSQEYIGAYSITVDNIENNIEEKELATIKITSIKEVAQKNSVKVYYVEVDLKNVITLQVEERKQLIYVDEKNGSYSMTLNNLVNQKYKNISDNNSINVPNSIEKNTSNTYLKNSVTDDEYTNELLSDFMYKILFNTQKAYDSLNEEYKNKKFSTINDFSTFIKNNENTYDLLYRSLTGNTLGLTTSQELENFRANKYKYGIKVYDKKQYNNIVQYIIIDKENKYYIFNEYGTMNYDVILDSYTTDVAGLKEEYEKLSDIKKYEYEINQYFEMINLQDFESAFNELDESIKKSNSQANFESYIKQNFWKVNYLDSIQQAESENGVKMFKVRIRESQYGAEVKEKLFGVSLVDGIYKIIIKE